MRENSEKNTSTGTSIMHHQLTSNKTEMAHFDFPSTSQFTQLTSKKGFFCCDDYDAPCDERQ